MTLTEKIASDLAAFGGYLQCLTCGHEQRVGNIERKLRGGWPRCCGYTMRWWTQRQIDSGEAPASSLR